MTRQKLLDRKSSGSLNQANEKRRKFGEPLSSNIKENENPVKKLLADTADMAKMYQLVKDIRDRHVKVIVVSGPFQEMNTEDPYSCINGLERV